MHKKLLILVLIIVVIFSLSGLVMANEAEVEETDDYFDISLSDEANDSVEYNLKDHDEVAAYEIVAENPIRVAGM